MREWQRVGQAGRGRGRDRVHAVGQRVRRLRRPRRPDCSGSATADPGQRSTALLRKWLRILPHPFTRADRAAGYRYDISILQAEFSLTQMLDRPLSGRILLDEVFRENLDVGRPDQVGLVFDRRIIRKGRSATPGVFRTRVLTSGVTPSLHVDYKHSQDQAVSQGRPRATHRDDHQRQP